MERSEIVATNEHLRKRDNIENVDVIESLSRKRASTNCKTYMQKIKKFLNALLKEDTTGSENAVLSETRRKNCSVRCLIFDKVTRKLNSYNLCFFRAFTLH